MFFHAKRLQNEAADRERAGTPGVSFGYLTAPRPHGTRRAAAPSQGKGRLMRVVLMAVAAAAVAALASGGAGTARAAGVGGQDSSFLVAAHQGNLAEIAAGNAAEKQGASSTVRSLGARLVQDHTTLDTTVTEVGQQLGVALPSSPSATQQSQLGQVSAQSGAAFDSAWLAAMIGDHRRMLSLIQTELQSGTSPQVQQVARSAQPVVQEHLNLLLAANGEAPGGANTGNGGQMARWPWAQVGAGAALLVGGISLFAFGARRRWARETH